MLSQQLMLKFKEASELLASEDAEEAGAQQTKDEPHVKKEENKVIEEFVDGDTGKSEPVIVQSAVDMSSTGSNEDFVLTVHKKDKKKKLRKRKRAEAEQVSEKKRRINFNLALNTTRGKPIYLCRVPQTR